MTKPQEQANDILSPVGDKEKQDSRGVSKRRCVLFKMAQYDLPKEHRRYQPIA